MMSETPCKKIVVAGHICLDITPVFPEGYRGKLPDLFIPGKLINVEQAQVHLGGAVANTGLAMAKYGADVHLMAKVGNDEFGEIVSRAVKAHGIQTELIISETNHTSYTVVLALPGHDRIFLHSPGANDTFVFEDLDMEIIKEAALFHFGYPPLMKRMYLEDGKQLTKIFQAVTNAGVATSLDLAAVDPNSASAQADWETILRNTLPFVDLFLPSVEELLFMLDRKRYEHLKDVAGARDLATMINLEEDVKPLAEKALQMGAKIVLIKCGEPGIYFKTADSSKISILGKKLGCVLTGWSDREGFEISYLPERVVSGTGAGDVTIAAFLVALLSEYPLEVCLRYATASGASCVEAHDSLSGLRTFDEIQKKIDAGWKKIQPVPRASY